MYSFSNSKDTDILEESFICYLVKLNELTVI